MAFKMKGSPAKMGMIKGTAGHRSALKAMEQKAAVKAMEKAAAMKAMEEKSAMKAMKEDSPAKAMEKNSPADFNAKLKQASADGKLSGKFKEAVDSSPAKFGPGKKETPEGYKKASKKLSDIKKRYDEKKAAKPKKSSKEAFDDIKKIKQKKATKSPSKAMEKSPMKEKALPTYNQAWDKMSEEKKKNFKSKEDFVSKAKAYNEKKYATTNPSKDSQKAGQTRKELADAHTKTTTTKVKTVKKDGEDVVVKKGAGANKGKTLTATQKSKERLKIDQANEAIKKAKKNKDRDARDRAQLEKAEIKAGRDNAKTGTGLSRLIAKGKVAYNKMQLKNRAKKNKDKE